MKLLLISNLYPNSLELSKATFNRRQFLEFSKHNDVYIIAQVAWTNLIRLKLLAGKFLPSEESIDGIKVFHPIYFFTPKVLDIFYGCTCFVSILPIARKLIKQVKPDYIFAAWAYPDGFAAILLGKLFKIPVFLKVHGSDIHSLQSRGVSYLTVWSLKRARRVFSVSSDLKRRMVKMGVPESHIVPVHNGIDARRFYPQDKQISRTKFNISSNSNVILFVGNLEYVKGPDVLLEAIKVLRDMEMVSDQFVLYFTGNGSLEKGLQEKCKLYNLEDNIIFYGSVVHTEMAEWMNIADLLIVPSRNEGVPNVILEGMACRIPVVATRVGGIPEVVQDGVTGYLVPPDDPIKLADAIITALKKPWDYEAILAQSKKFSWEKNATVILEQIERDLVN